MGARPRKRAISRWVTKHLANPLVRPLIERGLFPPTQALLETKGRRSGAPRRVPVGNGLRGDTFWIVTEHGRASHYVRNIEADPRVRIKVGRGDWRAGTAHLLDDDDTAARLRMLGRPVNDALLRLVGTAHLTIRIDLDRPGGDSFAAPAGG